MESDSDFTTSYFADLGDESALTPTLVREAALALKRNRREFLNWRSTGNMIQALAKVGETGRTPTIAFANSFARRAQNKPAFPRRLLTTASRHFSISSTATISKR